MPVPGFKQRVLTAIIFGIAVIGMIYLHQMTCSALFLLIGLWVTYEYSVTVKAPTLYVNLLLCAAAFLYLHFYAAGMIIGYLLAGSVLMATVLTYFVFHPNNRLDHKTWSPVVTILYLGVPMGGLSAYISGMERYTYFILGVIVMIWLSDSGAYLVGSKIGKRKLIPRISPNKTVEGFLGSLIAAMAGALVLSKINDFRPTDWWITIAIVVWIVGSVGDLVQSSIKRKYGVKDTGTILPGHGGVWDRFDSFIMVTPFVLIIDKYLI